MEMNTGMFLFCLFQIVCFVSVGGSCQCWRHRPSGSCPEGRHLEAYTVYLDTYVAKMRVLVLFIHVLLILLSLMFLLIISSSPLGKPYFVLNFFPEDLRHFFFKI